MPPAGHLGIGSHKRIRYGLNTPEERGKRGKRTGWMTIKGSIYKGCGLIGIYLNPPDLKPLCQLINGHLERKCNSPKITTAQIQSSIIGDSGGVRRGRRGPPPTASRLRIRYYRHVRPRSRYWKKMGVRISKEKRKAERTASNQALSLNMMKFLNQTASGSTVPSESIASTSTQQTSEIPLGNAPDALSTESELQLDVELGSCSSQSKWTLKFLCCHQVIKKNRLKKQSIILLLDCTRDCNRVEQMSVILRFCDTSTGTIVEHFMGFLAVTKTTGEYLANAILEHLEKYDLNIQDCRGQGYDNGANMVGVNTGVKTRILNINPRAFFTPCGCHSWNLLLVDAANSSVAAKTFFGFIQKIYLLFSSSSKRWDLIKGKLKLTMKPLSDTRWESRVEAVKAVLLQFDEVIECIESLKNQTEQSDTLSDCDSGATEQGLAKYVLPTSNLGLAPPLIGEEHELDA
ncbi:52 kDa repressor of the inhibitor of the protein kinase [Eumeta japonica]|uniref:52 kDa repressor of the inhibitor of the protein kinase n=1 Tax=Eumeta variegata TaxID=151549 RepID=A0A4C1Y376_EUMVA|nr:52 kDa repressor of the inhibitor of the protein kinase [Eumeta japonica]